MQFLPGQLILIPTAPEFDFRVFFQAVGCRCKTMKILPNVKRAISKYLLLGFFGLCAAFCPRGVLLRSSSIGRAVKTESGKRFTYNFVSKMPCKQQVIGSSPICATN